MRTTIAAVVFWMLAATSPPSLAAKEEPPALANNPFSRPPSEVLREERRITENNDGSGPTLALQATMVGRASRLANVDGRVLKPGDEIQGYVLIAIHEAYAVFERDGNPVTVYVKPHLAENDE